MFIITPCPVNLVLYLYLLWGEDNISLWPLPYLGYSACSHWAVHLTISCRWAAANPNSLLPVYLITDKKKQLLPEQLVTRTACYLVSLALVHYFVLYVHHAYLSKAKNIWDLFYFTVTHRAGVVGKHSRIVYQFQDFVKQVVANFPDKILTFALILKGFNIG